MYFFKNSNFKILNILINLFQPHSKTNLLYFGQKKLSRSEPGIRTESKIINWQIKVEKNVDFVRFEWMIYLPYYKHGRKITKNTDEISPEIWSNFCFLLLYSKYFEFVPYTGFLLFKNVGYALSTPPELCS